MMYISAASPSDPGAVVWPDCQLHIKYVTFTCMPAKLKNIMLQSCGEELLLGRILIP